MEFSEQNRELELIRKSIKGERSAFQELYNKNSRWMFAVCLRYHKNQEDAEDVLQESFIQIYKNLSSFKFEGNFKGWMRRITVNCALAKFRTNKIDFVSLEEQFSDSNENVLDTSLMDEINTEELIYYIDRLSQGRKQVFLAYAVDGLKHKEIAEILGISEGTSKSQLFDARKELINAIKNDLVNINPISI
jgi:RNA polymerase sigma factor (sigma-70 family)